MNSPTKGLVIIGVAYAVISILSINLAVAQSTTLQGSFVQYSIQASSTQRQIQGTLKQEVLQDYGDGRVKVKLTGEFKDTRFSLERNVSASRVIYPVVPSLPESFSFSTTRNNVSVSISVTRLGTEELVFQGAPHRVNVTSFSAEVRHPNGTTTLSGTLRTFQSGLLYRLDASSVSSGTLAITLLATNLDVDTRTVSATLSGLIAAITGSNPESVQTSTPVSASSPAAELPFAAVIAIVAVGVGAVIIMMKTRRVRSKPGTEAVPERPPHWVQLSG